MTRPDATLVQYYRERAAEYEQIYYRDDPPRRKEIDDEASRLKELCAGRDVLDVPCGSGYWTEVMSPAAQGITAADISIEMLNEARKKSYACPVDFIAAELHDLPFLGAQFDLVTLGFWLSHEPKQTYRDLFDTLTHLVGPGGLIWMIDNNPTTEGTTVLTAGTDAYGNNLKKRWLKDGREFVILKNYFVKDDLSELFENDFDIIKLIYGHYYWSVVLKPK